MNMFKSKVPQFLW